MHCADSIHSKQLCFVLFIRFYVGQLYKFTILIALKYICFIELCKCPVLRIKTKTKLQNFVRFISIFFLQIITKISTREIRFPNICEIKYAQKLVRSRIRYLFPTCMPRRTFIKTDKNNIIGRASEELPTAWQPPTSFVIVTENWKFQQSCRCCDWILSPCLIQGTAILNSRWFSLCIQTLKWERIPADNQPGSHPHSFLFSLILFFLL